MPELVARLVDRINGRVVRWRVGGRQPRLDPAAVSDYAASNPAPLRFSRDEQACFRPKRSAVVRTGAETWEADSPLLSSWSDDPRWVATRLVPARDATRRPRSTVIFLHGWLATRGHLHVYRGLAEPLRRAGVEVWMPRLPRHVERSPAGVWSGERALSSDMVATAETLRRAVLETIALRDWLREHGRGVVGVWGISLGGWTSALCASVDSDWDSVVLWEPVAHPQATFEEAAMLADMRSALEHSSVEPSMGARVLRELSPVHRRLRVPRDRVLLLGARYDAVVSVEALRLLAREWGVGVCWLPHGHISLIYSRPARSATLKFLTRVSITR